MRRREFLTTVAGALLGWRSPAGAASGVPRIGLLFVNSVAQERAMFGDDPFGFADLGYVEGKTVAFQRRYANGDSERLAALAQELVALKVDAIVTGGPGVYAAHRATTDIPIVAGAIGDPVAYGFAAKLAHPGGNVTGSALFGPQLLAKRLELLKQIVPSLKRAGVLLIHDFVANRQLMDAMAPTAKALKVELLPMEVAGPGSYEDVFSTASIDGLAITEPAQLLANAALIASLANKHGWPACGAPIHATAGATLGYGASIKDLFHNAATFVDKILKGGKPGDIPFEQATKFETVVNLKTAQALGLDVPPELLAQATKVIE